MKKIFGGAGGGRHVVLDIDGDCRRAGNVAVAVLDGEAEVEAVNVGSGGWVMQRCRLHKGIGSVGTDGQREHRGGGAVAGAGHGGAGVGGGGGGALAFSPGWREGPGVNDPPK